MTVKDVAGLADLYAVGVVGAIATNLGAASTDKKLDLKRWERILIFCTFLIMTAIEISLFIDKPNARLFAATILVFGLILRGLVHQVRDWYSGAAAYFGWMREAKRENTRCGLRLMSDKAAGQKTRSPKGCDENGPAAALLVGHVSIHICSL